jgi:anion-transporting  ArsA/GET3 family ATPase
MRLLDRLSALQLIVVAGKGGVGKTAVSSALGTLLARAGRRTLVLEVDPRDNVHQMLGVEPSGGAIVPAAPRLWAQNLKPGRVLDDIVRERLRIELLARRVLASPIYQHFSAGAPGLQELAILGHALRLVRGRGGEGAPELDTVVLDAPATGHGVRLLAAPRLVAEVIRSGPFGALAGELAGWLADDARAGTLVVTQAEEMPVEESLELRAALADLLGREPLALIVNGLYPPLAADESAGRTAAGATAAPAVGAPDLDPALLALWRDRRRLNERELAHLAARWPGLRIELPLLPLDRGPGLVTALTVCLAPALAADDSAPPSPSPASPTAPPPASPERPSA